jgi:hypothetical protein
LHDNIHGVWIIAWRKWGMEAKGRAQKGQRSADADPILQGKVIVRKEHRPFSCLVFAKFGEGESIISLAEFQQI